MIQKEVGLAALWSLHYLQWWIFFVALQSPIYIKKTIEGNNQKNHQIFRHTKVMRAGEANKTGINDK